MEELRLWTITDIVTGKVVEYATLNNIGAMLGSAPRVFVRRCDAERAAEEYPRHMDDGSVTVEVKPVIARTVDDMASFAGWE